MLFLCYSRKMNWSSRWGKKVGKIKHIVSENLTIISDFFSRTFFPPTYRNVLHLIFRIACPRVVVILLWFHSSLFCLDFLFYARQNVTTNCLLTCLMSGIFPVYFPWLPFVFPAKVFTRTFGFVIGILHENRWRKYPNKVTAFWNTGEDQSYSEEFRHFKAPDTEMRVLNEEIW